MKMNLKIKNSDQKSKENPKFQGIILSGGSWLKN